jgi:hypothetical protein
LTYFFIPAKAFQVIESQWEDIARTNQQINAIAQNDKSLEKKFDAEDLEHEMESVKYCLWMNPDRASAFFPTMSCWSRGQLNKRLSHDLYPKAKLMFQKAAFMYLTAWVSLTCIAS